MSKWNGYPENPERDGWHWLRHHDASFCVPVEWRATCGWVHNNIPMLPKEVLSFVVECCEYLGPCLTPAEIAAREQAARREGMEMAAKIADATKPPEGPMPSHMEKHSKETLVRASVLGTKREIAAAIRAAIEKEPKE